MPAAGLDAGVDVNDVGLLVLAVALLAATGFALWRRRTDGRLRVVAASDADAGRPVFPTDELGVQLGERATLVQFSSAFCQPCRATRRVLAEVAATVGGVVAVDVDAESHLDLVRQWDVMRTPTVFILDPVGGVAQRASGQPRTVDVIAAIGALDAPASGS